MHNVSSQHSPEDGNIRIHLQTYQTFQMSILKDQATFEYVIPIKVRSLKAIYFTVSPQEWAPVEAFDQTDFMCALESKPSAIGATIMETSWFWNNLGSSQFCLDGRPSLASPVNVRIGFSENIAESARALHFGHNSADGNYLSLLQVNGTYMEHNFILGQELESFSQNGPVMRVVSTLSTVSSHSDCFLTIPYMSLSQCAKWVL